MRRVAAAAGIELVHLSPEYVAARQTHADEALEAVLARGDETFARLHIHATAQDWLREMPWKRVVASELVGDLVGGSRRARVLEVGGGLSGVTLALAQRQDYRLVELATHEDADVYASAEADVGRKFVTIGDWADAIDRESFDVVIANDIFPNVDQRLDEFAERFEGTGTELRLSLTYYERTAFFVQRVDSGELLVVKPWGQREVQEFVERLGGPGDQVVYQSYEGDLFRNRRNVILLRYCA